MVRRLCGFMLLAATGAPAQVHRSPLAGKWFPADAAKLNELLDQAFAGAEKRSGSAPARKRLLALIVPHAAPAFAGMTAAAAYRQLDHPKTIILLAFSHRRRLEGVVAPELQAYAIPTGEVKVNREAVRALGFRTQPEDQLCDHSLEVQLPFLRRAVPDAAIVPLYVGMLDPAALAATSQKLSARLAKGELIIASSDLTHYGDSYGYKPFPKEPNLPKQLFRRALDIFDQIGSLDASAFDQFVAETRENLCGWGPIRLLMATLARQKADTYLSTLDYTASGDLTGDYSTSVGYGALGFYPASAFAVGPSDQTRLLASARQTLDKLLRGARERVPVPAGQRGSDLEQRTGVFVTVKKDGKLRGCVGALLPPRPLWETVADRTLAAAAEDPRFKPVSAQEAPLSLEISLLTPLKRIQSWKQFRLGQGAVILLEGKSGLLLPQIAAENNWNREQFLENLSQKAGLPPNAYRDSRATLYVYSAQVFAEDRAHHAGNGRK